VAEGNLTVTISESPQVSQPAALSRGRTVVVPRTQVTVQEAGKGLALVHEGVSLQQIVDGLNALGIGPRDLITILQAIKAAGAIQADIEGDVMTSVNPIDLGASLSSIGDASSSQAQAALRIKGKTKEAAQNF